MEAIHQVVNGKVLNRVINLPKAMQDIYVEVTLNLLRLQSWEVQFFAQNTVKDASDTH